MAYVLILGICDAIFAFTKLVCPIVRYLRSRGVNVLVYIDNFFISHKSEQLVIKSRNFLIFTHTKCGWLLSVPKHKPVAQLKVFLVLTINSLTMQFEVPNSKLIQFCELLQHVKSQASMPVRLLVHFFGFIKLLQ